MKRNLLILAFLGGWLAAHAANTGAMHPYAEGGSRGAMRPYAEGGSRGARQPYAPVGKCAGAVIDKQTGDTIYLGTIRDFYVYPKMRFRNKQQERFYWRTVRDVKKTLPYAKLIAREMEKTNELMSHMTRKQQKKYWKQYEKLLFARYEDEFKHMTVSQGQMLMLLVDRETNITSYDCIKMFNGNLSAMFWQGIAKMFGNDLKVEYDGADKDQIVERVIMLVEAGQL